MSCNESTGKCVTKDRTPDVCASDLVLHYDFEIGLEEDAFKRQALESIRGFLADDARFRTGTQLQPHAFEKAFGKIGAAFGLGFISCSTVIGILLPNRVGVFMDLWVIELTRRIQVVAECLCSSAARPGDPTL